MEEKKCLFCDKVVEQTEGKRPRLFCKDTNCRTAYWKKNVAPDKLKIEKETRNKFWEDLMMFGVAVSKKDENGIKRIDPLSNEALVIRYGITSTEMTVEEVKEKFGVEVKFPIPPTSLDTRKYTGKRVSNLIVDEKGQTNIPNPKFQDEAGQLPVLTNIEDIQKQIAAIRSEKIPKERDTPIGRKVWEIDQKKRIADLQSKN